MMLRKAISIVPTKLIEVYSRIPSHTIVLDSYGFDLSMTNLSGVHTVVPPVVKTHVITILA
jgi:hypothetical protein